MRKSRAVSVRGVMIGGGSPITVQSMTNTDTADKIKTLAQIKQLEDSGADIVRFTVNNAAAADCIPFYLENTKLPLVADIHFDHRLAIAAAERGISKIRINPGNIGDASNVRAVVDICRARNIPIRIGINGGSLEARLIEKYGSPTPEAMAESALDNIRMLERFDYENIVVSIKASDPIKMIAANRIIAAECDYPLHLGVTEAGIGSVAVIKGAVGIGSLLADGIGDTIRVSITEDVTAEIGAGKNILRALGLTAGINLISCPTCGRCSVDLIPIAKSLNEKISKIKTDKKIDIALMGCVVNGIGEGKQADIGIACGDSGAVLFSGGKILRTIAADELESALLSELALII